MGHQNREAMAHVGVHVELTVRPVTDAEQWKLLIALDCVGLVQQNWNLARPSKGRPSFSDRSLDEMT